MNKRIKILRKELGLTQSQLAESLHITKSAIANIETGARNITDRTISDICREFNVNEEWLRNGTEPMFKELDDIDELAAEFGLDEYAIRALKALQQLTPANREMMMRVIVAVCKEHGVDTSELETKSDIEPPKMDISIQEQANLLRARADALEKGNAGSTTLEKQA